MSKQIKYFFAVLTIFISSPVLASTTISTFTLSNQNAISGQLISLSWSGQETSGYNISFSCALGVKIKKEDGSVLSCDSKFATSNQDNDSMNFLVINIGGSNKTVTFRVYPKDKNGVEISDISQSQTMVISPSTAPITTASLSATTTTSGKPVTVSWTSTDLDGVNLILDCIDGITYSSQSDFLIPIQCGTNAFTDQLSGASGSKDIYFKNRNADKSTIQVKVLPYIGGGSYDLSHASSLYLDVSSEKVQPAQITSFTSSQSKTFSSTALTLTWTSKNTTGVNIKYDCADSLGFMLATSSSKIISCNDYISDFYLDPNSSITFIINNPLNITKSVYFTLYSYLPTGGYDGVNTTKLTASIPSNSSISDSPATPYNKTVVSTQITQVQNIASSAKKVTSARKKFLKALSLGSKGDDVSALQEFLRNNNYYPEGLVTGYMGPATVKAVKRFQEQNGIAKQGQAGYGNLGPATRAKINSL